MFGPVSKAQLDQDVPAFLRKGTELLRAFEAKSAELRAEHEKSGAKKNPPAFGAGVFRIC